MLSRAEVAKTVVVMKRFWPYIEVDDVAVGAWLALFTHAGIDDAETLSAAVLSAATAGTADEREIGARIIDAARGIRGEVEDPWAHLRDVTAEVVEESKRRQLEAANVTEAEYEARKHDPAWIAATFTRPELEHDPSREEWL